MFKKLEKDLVMFNLRKKSFKKFDFALLMIVILLCAFGLVILKSATLSFEVEGFPNRYMSSQIAATLAGLAAVVIIIFMDYQFIGKLYIPIYIICVGLLAAVLLFGIEGDLGGKSWLSIGSFRFQPSEFVKIGLIISLAKFIDINKETLNEPFTLIKVLGFAFFPVVLILLQPDAGTAMVFIFFIAAMFFIAGIKWKYIGYAVLLGLMSLPILWFRLDEYQKDRILDFTNPERDAIGTGYQAIQGRVAIGSGKVFGRGLFEGTYTQYNYIPTKHTDFIFAVLVEELGFIGGVSLILLYFMLIQRIMKVTKKTENLFGSLMCVGIAAMFLFHIWENIGMTIGLMPITGIPLPFLSHGGTFQLANFICIGIVLCVGLHKEGLSFGEN